jgi:hypothetical protein
VAGVLIDIVLKHNHVKKRKMLSFFKIWKIAQAPGGYKQSIKQLK